MKNGTRMLFHLKHLCWDAEILRHLRIPRAMLPEVHPSSHLYGYTDATCFGAAIDSASGTHCGLTRSKDIHMRASLFSALPLCAAMTACATPGSGDPNEIPPAIQADGGNYNCENADLTEFAVCNGLGRI